MAGLRSLVSKPSIRDDALTIVHVVCFIGDIRLQEAGELIGIGEASHVEGEAETSVFILSYRGILTRA